LFLRVSGAFDSNNKDNIIDSLNNVSRRLDSAFYERSLFVDSLEIRILEMSVSRIEDSIVINELKIRRDEEINAIDTMDHHDLYLFFSNQ